jgi:hypothetical protein
VESNTVNRPANYQHTTESHQASPVGQTNRSTFARRPQSSAGQANNSAQATRTTSNTPAYSSSVNQGEHDTPGTSPSLTSSQTTNILTAGMSQQPLLPPPGSRPLELGSPMGVSANSNSSFQVPAAGQRSEATLSSPAPNGNISQAANNSSKSDMSQAAASTSPNNTPSPLSSATVGLPGANQAHPTPIPTQRVNTTSQRGGIDYRA